MPRTIVVGDIHGCLIAFNALLNAIQLAPTDTLVTVGDYVDRGPDSKGVLDRLLELEQSCNLVPLLGNHEEMLLAVLERRMEPYGWLNHGGVQTMDSYGFNGDLECVPKSHRDLMNRMPSYYENDTHFVVHANYEPTLPLDEQPSELLRWIKISDFLPEPHVNGKRAIVGHTHDRKGEIFELPHLVCIDTYCYGGKWLTALELETGRIWQSTPDGFLIDREMS
ncbi:MAG: metallophosphoesterase family protein [Pirellula sp.]